MTRCPKCNVGEWEPISRKCPHCATKPQPIRCLCGHSWNDHHKWLDPMEHACTSVPCKGDGCKCTMFDQA